MKNNQYQRQTLAQEMGTSLKIADFISAGIACVGLFFIVQPSRIAQTIGLSSLLAGGASAGVTRLTHKRYVDFTYSRVKATSDASEGQIRTLTQQVTDLELQLAHVVDELSENSDLLKRQISAQVEAEKELKAAIAQFIIQKRITEEELTVATAKGKALMASENELLLRLKETTQESLEYWHSKLLGLAESAKAKNINLEAKLQKIVEGAKLKTAWYEAEITKINPGDGGVGDCADELISLLHSIYDHYGLLRVQIINSLHIRGKQELMAAVEALTHQLEELKAIDTVPREHLETLIENYKARLEEFQTSYGEHASSTIQIAEALEKEVLGQDPIFEKMHFLLDQQAQQIQGLEGKLKQAEQIKIFEGVSPWRETANKVLMHFASHSIVCDASTVPINELAHDIEFMVVPRTRIGMSLVQSDIEKAAESLRLPLGVKSVKISIEGKNIKVKIPIRDKQTVEKERPEDVLGRSTSLWSLYVGSEYHLVIFAATQSGKTSLADELNAMMHTRLEGRIKFHAITLKNDGNRDGEEKTRRFVKPRFMASHEAYRGAICGIHEEIQSRNLLLQVNPDKSFDREIFQWDEYGEFYRLSSDEEKKEGKKAVISLLQTGAGLSSETGMGLSLTLIAQNPYVSTLGVLRPDLANACIVIVGDKNIRLFLESDSSNHGLDLEDIARLKEELSIFKEASREASDKATKLALENGQDAAIAIRRCPENYYSLVVPSKAGLKPLVIYNPTPGEFSNALVEKVDTQSKKVIKPTCPDCKTTHTSKMGNQGRHKCLNPECSRKTFTWK